MAYKQEPGRGPTATFKNVTALLGPTAPGNPGDPGKDFNKKQQKKEQKKYGCIDGVCAKPEKKTRFKDSNKSKKSKGKNTVETKHYSTYETDPNWEVAARGIKVQELPNAKTIIVGDTGFIHSDGGSVSDFKEKTKNKGIPDKVSGHIERNKPEQTYAEKSYTKFNKKGKQKMSVTQKGTTDKDLQSKKYGKKNTPSDLKISKRNIFGKNKVKNFTTEESRAYKGKGKNPGVKLVSKEKMNKKTRKALDKISKNVSKTIPMVKNNELTKAGIRKKQEALEDQKYFTKQQKDLLGSRL